MYICIYIYGLSELEREFQNLTIVRNHKICMESFSLVFLLSPCWGVKFHPPLFLEKELVHPSWATK